MASGSCCRIASVSALMNEVSGLLMGKSRMVTDIEKIFLIWRSRDREHQ